MKGAYSNSYPASWRLDIDELRKFVNVITFEEYFSKENCGSEDKLDLAIFARSRFGPEAMTHLYAYETSRKINITHTDEITNLSHNLAKITILPSDVKKMIGKKNVRGVSFKNQPHAGDEVEFIPTKKIINEIYGPKAINTDGKCAMWLFPFRNMKFEKKLSPGEQKGDNKYGEQYLTSRMMTATLRAPAVRRAAEEFIVRSFGKLPFYSMHWRYDEKDFLSHCKKSISAGNVLACSFLLSENMNDNLFKARIISRKMYEWMNESYENEVREANKKNALNARKAAQMLDGGGETYEYKNITVPRIKALYVSSPRQDLGFIKELTRCLGMLSESDLTGSLKVFNQEHLLEFLQRKFRKSCTVEEFNQQSHEFISQVEQEICMKSTVFIESEGSSWSGQVERERYVRGNYVRDTSNKQFFGSTTLENRDESQMNLKYTGGIEKEGYIEQSKKKQNETEVIEEVKDETESEEE